MICAATRELPAGCERRGETSCGRLLQRGFLREAGGDYIYIYIYIYIHIYIHSVCTYIDSC